MIAPLLLASVASAQVDLNGDGMIDAVIHGEFGDDILVHDGTTGQTLWSRSGPSLYGWAVTAHPDIDGDGLRDLIVTMPGGNAPGSGGEVHALRGLDGQVLWTRQYGEADNRFGFGIGVVPDQNYDGCADVLVAMLSDEPAGETAVLLSGLTGEVLATEPGPVASLLDAARRGSLRFRPADLDNSGEVEAADAVLVITAVGTPTPDADLDFDGDVDVSDIDAVLDGMNDIGAGGSSTWEYVKLSVIDPALYNDGYQMIPLLVGYTMMQDDQPDYPCEAEYRAAKQAALEYANAVADVPWWHPWDYPAWDARVRSARQLWHDAKADLQDCLASHDLPPWIPGMPLDPPPPPPDPVPDPGGGGGGPDSGCPLDDSSPPPTPTDPDMDPCFNQMTTNFLLCITCRSHGVSSEPYEECLQRARDFQAQCSGNGTANE